MAHSNGVSFYGKNYQSRATRQKSGEIDVVIKKLNPLPVWLHNMLNIPLLRGIADTIYAFYMKWYIGVFFLIAPILMNYRVEFIADRLRSNGEVDILGFISGFLTGILVLILMLKLSPLGKYHAAEHVMHNLYLQNRPLTVEEGRNTTRIHEWCGSSWYILLVIYSIVMAFVPLPLLLKLVMWYPFYGEVLMNSNKIIRTILMPFKLAGYGFQLLTTSKPKDEHLEVSLQAFVQLLEQEKAIDDTRKHA